MTSNSLISNMQINNLYSNNFINKNNIFNHFSKLKNILLTGTYNTNSSIIDKSEIFNMKGIETIIHDNLKNEIIIKWIAIKQQNYINNNDYSGCTKILKYFILDNSIAFTNQLFDKYNNILSSHSGIIDLDSISDDGYKTININGSIHYVGIFYNNSYTVFKKKNNGLNIKSYDINNILIRDANISKIV